MAAPIALVMWSYPGDIRRQRAKSIERHFTASVLSLYFAILSGIILSRFKSESGKLI
jgi:hypothetical protein